MRFLAFTLLLLLLAVGSSAWLTRPLHEGRLDDKVFQSLSIAPAAEAVTLARTNEGAVLLVTAVDANGVSAIDIGGVLQRQVTDTLQVYAGLGADGLRGLRDGAPVSRFAWEALGMPLDDSYPHVAAGTNYSAHAQEVGHEGDPFLFPKLSRPTAWNSRVAPGGRIDYEVELCAVLLAEHSPETPPSLGYVLCGDFTDRWLLVRDIDLDGAMGRTGFPLAKGGEYRFPIGPLLVIPEHEDFYRGLTLSLYVDDQLRQSAAAGQMIWSPREILSRALADCRVPYALGTETVFLGECEALPAGTLLLTGTPEGVLFHLATLWNPWAYLREGDVVTSFGAYLGYMRNVIGGD